MAEETIIMGSDGELWILSKTGVGGKGVVIIRYLI